MTQLGSTPSFEDFNPKIIPYQWEVIKTVRDFDYSKGALEVLLSGSVGSAKSILMAHIALYHCLTNPGARILLGRKALPDLKDTIFQKILEHIEGSNVEAYVRNVNYQNAKIQFVNGSEIMSRSWADKKYKKMRSLELSGAVIEELTENDEKDKQAYLEIKMRVGRLPHIKQNFILAATNPDSPAHWAYKHFIAEKHDTRSVFYSRTEDNPFLPPQYIDQLKKDLDPKLAQRMLEGKWIEITQEVVYYAYGEHNFHKDQDYQPNLRYPIWLSWDFNIGHGKPLSMVCGQFINDTLYLFDEVVVEGMRTEDSCDELAGRGLLDHATNYIVTGDASGRNRDTRSKRTDYDIINKYLSNYVQPSGRTMVVESKVPRSNSPIRKRHNLVNAYCRNTDGQVRLKVYKRCKTVDEGLRLTQLKKGGHLIEDDSKSYQHVTTAVGYLLLAAKRTEDKQFYQTRL